MHRLLHASGSHPIPTPYDPNTVADLPRATSGRQLTQRLAQRSSTNPRQIARPVRTKTAIGHATSTAIARQARCRACSFAAAPMPGPKLVVSILKNEGLTRSARMDSPRRIGRKQFSDEEEAAAAAARGGDCGGGSL
ncbi:Mitochondrial-processing peptidase subunit alpha isoform 1 [Dorcoceras hygrometricum]|uniref:Mitochondrial-processing peptidase subunit alpha isoform 1 n=1 Tax=Dorcoceras hygrometricum TaxID=472368 RepID=A0A2Z7B173_9LAMI|nr:Mitochondrial-processing peptidase subunit alpha isoform 1 [Dorcoceras hygrometricum]